MTTAAWVTLIFAAIEFAAAHNPAKWPAFAAPSGDWTPSVLPPAETEAVCGEKPRSRAHAIAEVIVIFLCLVWFLLVPDYPYLLFGPGVAYLSSSPFQGAPVWVQFYWCVVAITSFQLVWRCIAIYRGRWQELKAERMAITALGLIPLGLLLSIGDHAYITLKHPALDQLRYGEALDSINKAIHLSLLLLCAITVLQLLWGIWRISLDFYRKRVAAM